MAKRLHAKSRAAALADNERNEHALSVRDADRLNELTPVMNELERWLKRDGIKIDFDFGHDHIQTVRCTLTTSAGFECPDANIVLTWVSRPPPHDAVLVVRVEGRNVRSSDLRPNSYDRRSTTGDFNYERITQLAKKFVNVDVALAERDRLERLNSPNAKRLEQEGQMNFGRAIHVNPDDGQEGYVRFKLDVSRKLSVTDAETVIRLLTNSGVFKILNGE